jgi:hypothetical protein
MKKPLIQYSLPLLALLGLVCYWTLSRTTSSAAVTNSVTPSPEPKPVVDTASYKAKLDEAKAHAAAGRISQALTLLTQIDEASRVPAEVLNPTHDMMTELLQPELTAKQRMLFVEVTAALAAAEKLSDLEHGAGGTMGHEMRTENRMYTEALRTVINRAEELLKQKEHYCPAIIAVAVAEAQLGRHSAAAEAFKRYLSSARVLNLPTGQRHGQILADMMVAQGRADADAGLAAQVVGKWQRLISAEGAPYAVVESIELKADGSAIFSKHSGKWRVVNRQLILEIDTAGTQWGVIANLAPDGHRAEGDTTQGDHVKNRFIRLP